MWKKTQKRGQETKKKTQYAQKNKTLKKQKMQLKYIDKRHEK